LLFITRMCELEFRMPLLLLHRFDGKRLSHMS
jgi:hypothetical protein